MDGNNADELVAGFDQEAAAVVIARLATHKMETEDDFDATRWLDRTLIRLASRFGDYRKDDPATFQLTPNMSYYPQFMFNLRRSQFVQARARAAPPNASPYTQGRSRDARSCLLLHSSKSAPRMCILSLMQCSCECPRLHPWRHESETWWQARQHPARPQRTPPATAGQTRGASSGGLWAANGAAGRAPRRCSAIARTRPRTAAWC